MTAPKATAANPCDESLPTIAAVFKAAGDTLRAQILRALRRDAFGVQELCRIFSTRQPAMSHHLKLLSKTGLVASKKEGTSIFYRRNCYSGDGLDTLRQQIFAQLDRAPLDQAVATEIRTIHGERATSSQTFFSNNLERFREQQDLIASHNQYGESLLELIDGLNLQANSAALEIGPGEGELLPHLAKRFVHVVALDNSAELLEKSRATCAAKFDNITFVHDDITALATPANADLVTLNMVLHHLPQPAETLKVIYQLLNPGGALIVTDLCQHEQDWAHTTCGDLWLGFCPEELTEWASSIGFREGSSLFLALRNGFRIQQRQFIKASA